VACASEVDGSHTLYRPPSTHGSPVPPSVSLARLEQSFRELWLPLSDAHLDALASRLRADANGQVSLEAFLAVVEPGAFAEYMERAAAVAVVEGHMQGAAAVLEKEGPVRHLTSPLCRGGSRGVNGNPKGVNNGLWDVNSSSPYARSGTPTSPWRGPAGLIGCSPSWTRPSRRSAGSAGGLSTSGLSAGGYNGSPFEARFFSRGGSGGGIRRAGDERGQLQDGQLVPAPFWHSETLSGPASDWYFETGSAHEESGSRYHKGMATPPVGCGPPHHSGAHLTWPDANRAAVPHATGRNGGAGRASASHEAWDSAARYDMTPPSHPSPPPPTPHHPPAASPPASLSPTPPVSVTRHARKSSAKQAARPSPLGASAPAQFPVRCLDFRASNAAGASGRWEGDGRAVDAKGRNRNNAPTPRHSRGSRSPPLCQPSQPCGGLRWSGEQGCLASTGEWAGDRETIRRQGMQTLQQLVGAAQQLLDRLVWGGAV
jgi:hypothetical protein